MSTLKKCSVIKIKSNYNNLEHRPYNTIGLGGNHFFKRTIFYQGELIDVVFKIDINGKVLDAPDDNVSLPCPRYCDDEKGESILRLDIKPNYLPNTILTGYDADLVNKLNQSGTNKFLELEIIDEDGTTKTALIGIDSNGRIMDDDDHNVIIK